MFNDEEIVDELLEDNEELEDLLSERTGDLIDALWLAVDTQSELLDVYRSFMGPDEDDEYISQVADKLKSQLN